ncbi:hypothetical protein EMIT0180MI3_12255 [Priestia megaterium]
MHETLQYPVNIFYLPFITPPLYIDCKPNLYKITIIGSDFIISYL